MSAAKERVDEVASLSSSNINDLNAIMAAMRLRTDAPNVDDVASALRRSLNIQSNVQDDSALREMADAFVRFYVNASKCDDEPNAVNRDDLSDGDSSPRSLKENDTQPMETFTTPPAYVNSGISSTPFTDSTPTTTNATPMSFVRKTPSTPSTGARTRGRSISRTRPGGSRSLTPNRSFFRRSSRTPTRGVRDESPKRSQSPFKRWFVGSRSDVKIPSEPHRSASASRSRPPPKPVRQADTTSEPFVIDTPVAKTIDSFPTPPSTSGNTFCSPNPRTPFQRSGSYPTPAGNFANPSESNIGQPQFNMSSSVPPPPPPPPLMQPTLPTAHSTLPTSPASQQAPLFSLGVAKSATGRQKTKAKNRRDYDNRIHKSGGPEKSHVNVWSTGIDTTRQMPSGAGAQVPPISETVPISGIQQTFSVDSGFRVHSGYAAPAFNIQTTPSNLDLAPQQPGGLSPEEMDISPQASGVASPDICFQFNIGAGDKKGRSKKNPRKVGSPNRGGIQFRQRPSQKSISGIFPRTCPLTANKPTSHSILTNTSGESADTSGGQTIRTASTMSSEVDYTGRQALVSSLREEARDAYTKHEFRIAVNKYSMALKVHVGESVDAAEETDDLRAVLLANRAASFFMLEAFEPAALDCQHALQFVSQSHVDEDGKLNSDAGPLLKAKLLARLGKSLLRSGKLQEAEQAFINAINTGRSTLPIVAPFPEAQLNLRVLTQMITDAESGKIEVSRCKEAADGFASRGSASSRNSPAAAVRRSSMQSLIFVNKALEFAPGCTSFHEKKLVLLASLKRWREAAGHCERLSLITMKWDGMFEGDLSGRNPFPQALPAKALDPSYFDNDPVESSTKKLGAKAVGEAVLRLNAGLLPLYLRSLRLEERYAQASAAIDSLEKVIKATEGSSKYQSVRLKIVWLSRERDKVNRTTAGKDRGDALFRSGDYQQAAAQYTSCLTIDGEGLPDAECGEVSNAGGRLHAILHCNRAACLMAMTKYHEAVTDCTSALRIHSHYMKAMLRRSRCYHKLQRFEEATVEFSRWIELVEKARKSPSDAEFLTASCLFDSPKDISNDELERVRRELLEVGRAKRMAENTGRSEANYRDSRQRWYEESFGRNDTSDPHQRREQWYNQQGTSSRRWDSFSGKSPKKETKPPGGGDGNTSQHHSSRQRRSQQQQQQQSGRSRHNEHGDSYNESSSSSQRQRQPQGSPGSDASRDHYSVLQIAPNASDTQLKKAFRKLALKYHPDKNSAPEAADKFRRVKLAYEVLNDTVARRKYDSETRWNRAYS